MNLSCNSNAIQVLLPAAIDSKWAGSEAQRSFQYMCLSSPARSRPYHRANFSKCQAFGKGASHPTEREYTPITQADIIRLRCMDMFLQQVTTLVLLVRKKQGRRSQTWHWDFLSDSWSRSAGERGQTEVLSLKC